MLLEGQTELPGEQVGAEVAQVTPHVLTVLPPLPLGLVHVVELSEQRRPHLLQSSFLTGHERLVKASRLRATLNVTSSRRVHLLLALSLGACKLSLTQAGGRELSSFVRLLGPYRPKALRGHDVWSTLTSGLAPPCSGQHPDLRYNLVTRAIRNTRDVERA